MSITIQSSLLTTLNLFEGVYPIKIDLIYANSKHPDNHFPGLYHPEAKILWLHADLAVITLAAAKLCHALYGWTLKINDGLRPVEAQEKMAEYGYHPSLVSPPGQGAHPRAMAVDIEPLDENGNAVPMGTPFDFFAPHPEEENLAARDYTAFKLSAEGAGKIIHNRSALEFAMTKAAAACKLEIWPLPQEWWDFRFPRETFEHYAPLREADLKPYQRLINPDIKAMNEILSSRLPEDLQKAVDDVGTRARQAVKKLIPEKGLERIF